MYKRQVYIRLRFSALGGLASGVTAVIALVHDILIVLFIFGIFRIPVNDAFVAVTLTIIGYSINDTIVLYDRIREHRSNMKKKSTLAELVDISTTETLQRSINTAFTVVLCAFKMCIRDRMKRKIGIAAAIILALFVVTGCQKQEATPKKSEQKKTEASEELLSGTHHAEIQVKDYGTITVEMCIRDRSGSIWNQRSHDKRKDGGKRP